MLTPVPLQQANCQDAENDWPERQRMRERQEHDQETGEKQAWVGLSRTRQHRGTGVLENRRSHQGHA